MIEREAPIKIYNETLGAKGAKGRLVRIAPEGFYEVIIESGRARLHQPAADPSTVILAAEPEEQVATLEVER